MCRISVSLFTILFIISFNVCLSKEKPNIVLILADDMGTNDASLHGSNQIPTPNIDALAFNGKLLNRHYTMHICTPSRAALLTGNYPIHSGMQGYVLRSGEPRALPLDMPTLAERLSELGYSTHLVGKWHLGHQNRKVTPNGRGFHTHLGYWSGFVGYFDYEIQEKMNANGFDLHRNYEPDFESYGTYATDLFTSEAISIIRTHNSSRPFFLMISHLAGHTGKNGTLLEVPDEEEAMRKFDYIPEEQRRLYAEIVVRLDESVGKIMRELQYANVLNNTIVIFLSDNGAETIGDLQNFGSNWPLRGMKYTLYEGGIRNLAAIWTSQLLTKQEVDNKNIYHICDWLPTLYAAAGGQVKNLKRVDGVNRWNVITSAKLEQRPNDLLINIDDVAGFNAVISKDGRYKFLEGASPDPRTDTYLGDSGRSGNEPPYNVTAVLESDTNQAILSTKSGSPLTSDKILELRKQSEIPLGRSRTVGSCLKGCLFDLANDPTESKNIILKHPLKFLSLSQSLNAFRRGAVPQTNKPVDPRSNPKFCNGTWFNWLDDKKKCYLDSDDLSKSNVSKCSGNLYFVNKGFSKITSNWVTYFAFILTCYLTIIKIV